MTITQLAYIQEDACIGCTKCIAVCPVDAIIGTEQWMHTVITAECIGCTLCIPACPVDCITMQPLPRHYQPLNKKAIQTRIEKRKKRLQKEQTQWAPFNESLANKKAYLKTALKKRLATRL